MPNIMLNSDMVLGFNSSVASSGVGVLNQNCGPYQRNGSFSGCSSPSDQSQPNTVSIVKGYVQSNANFLAALGTSYKKMLSVGYGAAGKLGAALVAVDLSKC